MAGSKDIKQQTFRKEGNKQRKGRKGNNNNNRNSNNRGPSNTQILEAINNLKQKFKTDPSFSANATFLATGYAFGKHQKYFQQVHQMLDEIPTSRLQSLAGQKLVQELIRKSEEDGTDLSKHQCLQAFLGDDWSSLANLVKVAAPIILPKLIRFAHNRLRKYPIYSNYIAPGIKGLSEYLGQGLNDDPGCFPKAQVLSISAPVKGSAKYTSVNRKAVATIFCPVTYVTRPVYHGIQKTSLIANSQLISVITNASGNAYIDICPAGIFGSAGFYNSVGALYNAADLNLSAGTQVSAPTAIAGQLSSSASNVAGFRVVAMVATIIKVPSALNQQGRVHMCIYDQPITSTRTVEQANIRTCGLTTAVASPYFATFSLADADGKQLIYNLYSDEAREQFCFNNGAATFPVAQSPNGFLVYVEGAQGGATVLQIQLRFVIEWTATAIGSAMSNYGLPDNGVATPQLVQSIFKNFPSARFLGLQESTGLANMLMALQTDDHDEVYDAISQYLSGVTLINTGGIGGGGYQPMIEPMLQVKDVPATYETGAPISQQIEELS